MGRNVTYLLILQVLNLALPFLMLPFYVRVLGGEVAGLVFFGFAAMQVCSVVTDYGFNLSATFRISTTREDTRSVNSYVSAVLGWKIVIISCTVVGYIFFVSVVPGYFGEHREFLLLLIPSIIGQGIQNSWYFQGVEKMGIITAQTAAARIFFAVATVAIVRGPDDYLVVPVLNGISLIGAGLLGGVMMVRLGYRPVWPGRKDLRSSITDSTGFFVSRAATTVYTGVAPLFIGAAGGPLSVAHYSAAEQLYRGGQSLVNPIVQAIFPHMARTRDLAYLWTWLRRVLVATAVCAVGGLLVGRPVLIALFGEEFADAYPTLVVFVAVFVVATPSVMLGYPLFAALGRPALPNITVIIGAFVQVIGYVVLVSADAVSPTAVATSILVTEIVVLALRSALGWNLYNRQRG